MKPATRVGFALSAAVTLVFFAMVLVMAFRPQLLTGFRGLWYSLAFILLTLVVMGGYSFWRLAEIDVEDE
jgi:uncharacterized membrane protein YhdT